MHNPNFAAVMDENMRSGPNDKASRKLSHISVTHHMTSGEPHVVKVEPGKMAEHVADCPHCGGGSAAVAAY